MTLIDSARTAVRDPYLVRRKALEYLYRAPVTGISATKGSIGTNVFSRDWDLLIILDTCRVDALNALVPEYDFLSETTGIRSVGGATPEWIAATFNSAYSDKIRETAYLAANPSADKILGRHDVPAVWNVSESHLSYRLIRHYDTIGGENLGRLEHLWKYEPTGESGSLGHESGATPPKYVTDRAIDVGRDTDYDRLIVHYHQPHTPYVANALAENRSLEPHEDNPFTYIRKTGDRETVWEAYLDELRWVLDDVAMLLDNVDAERAVISADHGEALGEYGVYGHLIGSLNPAIRQVPWVETAGTDTGTYTPQFDRPEGRDVSADEQLAALGYKF